MEQTASDSARSEQSRASEERHYTLQEIATLWRISIDSARRIFAREAGVLIIGDSNPRGRRRYVTLRVPTFVLERVHRRLSLSKQ